MCQNAVRGFPRVKAALLAVALGLALAVASPATRPAAAAPSAALAARTPAPGVQAHLLWSHVDGAEVDRQLDRARAALAAIVRVDVGWSTLEAEGKGVYSSWYLSKLDALVAKAEARGLDLLLTFWSTPCWASSAPEEARQGCAGAWWERGVDRYAPLDPSDYAEALAFLARRYRGRVAAWELWNEPNHADFLKADDPAAAYARLARAAYGAAKEADPAARVVAGSLSEADFEFTAALYRHGIRDAFDAYSIHPYSGDRSPLDPDDEWIRTSFIYGVPAVREVMAQNGDGKPVWLTELGWSTCAVRGKAVWANCVDEATQARYLREAYRQAASWDYVAVAVWFKLQDTSDDPGDRVAQYGLLGHDGAEKDAYVAFRRAAADLLTGGAQRASPVPARPR